MQHPLTDNYRNGRRRLLALGQELSDAEGATVSTACPAWTVKDLYGHLAGISADILSGNTAEAATPAWADAHVVDRAEQSLSAVLDEWRTAGDQVSELMSSAGEAFPVELFVDQWTHEWDIRAALGPRAAAVPDLGVYDHYLDRFAEVLAADESAKGLDRVTIDVEGRELPVGDGDDVGRLPLSMFEFARLSMGRRSQRQIEAMSWPIEDVGDHVAVVVRWTVADDDVVDPVI